MKLTQLIEQKERPYICVHADKGKHETHAVSSYDAAKNAAKHWGMKSTSGIDAHLAEGNDEHTGSGRRMQVTQADKDNNTEAWKRFKAGDPRYEWKDMILSKKEGYNDDEWSDEERAGMEYTVWVGGTEVNDNWLSYDEAVRLYDKYKAQGYDDVQLDARMKESYSPGDEYTDSEGMVSNCCGAPMMDYNDGHGRCSDCKEMAAGETDEEFYEDIYDDGKLRLDPKTGKYDPEEVKQMQQQGAEMARQKANQNMRDKLNRDIDVSQKAHTITVEYDLELDTPKSKNPLLKKHYQLMKKFNVFISMPQWEEGPPDSGFGAWFADVRGSKENLKGWLKAWEYDYDERDYEDMGLEESMNEDEEAVAARDEFLKVMDMKPKSSNKAIDTIKKIVADKQNMQVKFDDGKMKVDLYTASAVSAVYDAVKPETKVKIDDMLRTKEGMLKMSNFAFSKLSEGIKEGKRIDEILPIIGAVAGAVGRAVVGGAAKQATKAIATKAAGAVGNAVGSAIGNANDTVNASKKSKKNKKKLNAVKNEETVKENKSFTDGTIKKLQYLVNTNYDVYEEMGDIFDMFGSPYTADDWLSHMKLTIDEIFTKEGSPVPPEVAKVYNDLEAYSKQTELQAKRRANTDKNGANDAIYGPENEDELYIRDNFAQQWHDAFHKVQYQLGLEAEEDFDESIAKVGAQVAGAAKKVGGAAKKVGGAVKTVQTAVGGIKDKTGKKHHPNSPQGKMIKNMTKQNKPTPTTLGKQSMAQRAVGGVKALAKKVGNPISYGAAQSGFGNPLAASKQYANDMVEQAIKKAEAEDK
jgi:uncharacterized membrane protein YeaQ/YmgE (transglycosylase-associated protein family)